MGKTTIHIPLITLRPDGNGGFRPRYIPGPKHRRLKLEGEDLRHGDGRWFSLDECKAWSDARLALVAELEAAATPRARRAVTRSAAGITLAELAEKHFKSPRLTGQALIEGKKRRDPLSDNTVRFYQFCARCLEALDDGTIWHSPAAAISARVLGDPDKGVLHKIEVKHGLRTARGVRSYLSSLYKFGANRGLVPTNPVAAIEETLPVPAPRVRYASVKEIDQLLRAAEALEIVVPAGRGGRKHAALRRFVDVGDAIVMGLWTGQRQADRLAIDDYRDLGESLLFQQQKKGGQPLLIEKAPALRDRLQAARRRRAPWKVNYPHVLLDEYRREPWEADRYRAAYALVRDAAARGILLEDGAQRVPAAGEQVPPDVDWLVMPMPSLADFHDQDLRDTAVTWLALAGNDAIHIASITGHSLQSINDILKHYLGLHPELARSAIGKLVEWFNSQKGETNG